MKYVRLPKMPTINHLVCFLLLLGVVCHTTQAFDRFGLMVEPKSPSRLCLKRGQNITLNCVLYSNSSFHSFNLTQKFANWSLQWYHNGLQWRNVTILQEANNSITSAIKTPFSGMYTCALMSLVSQNFSKNLSVSLQMQPKAVTSLTGTPRFVGKKDGFRYVMISWLKSSYEYVYSVFFKIEQWGRCFPSPCLDGRVYPKCVGINCTVAIDTYGYNFGMILFYFVTREKGCETRSKVWKFNLTLSECNVLPLRTLFYVPYSPTQLHINTSHRSVTVKWRDVSYLPLSGVLLTYNCSKHSNHSMTLGKIYARIIRLTDKDIRGYIPYGKCTFCLAVKAYNCGRYSEPLCNTTRLHEEPPSQAPSITCSNDTCPSTYDDRFRNVTVTWKLPPKATWRGVLRRVNVLYRDTSTNTTGSEIAVTDMSSNSVVIKGLNRTQDYVIYLQLCNTEGCSAFSSELFIFGVKGTKKPSSGEGDTSVMVWYIIGGLVFLVLIIGGVMMALRFSIMRRKNAPTTLEHLSEPESHYEIDYKDEPYHELEQFDEPNGN